ncbi:hypothetical protein ACFQ1S_10400 [Kibdelosporangium lantanae]|uniref:Uncharacterized protein n=1 Tax=Kibdelosporangium lantanae TaxID=1497396 RepID=A0ABW3M5K9_9PSEU
MDLIDLIVEPRRTISALVIAVAVVVGAIAIINQPNTTSFLGVGILLVSIVCAIITLRLRKWKGAVATLVTVAVFVGGIYVIFVLGRK